MFLNVYYKRKTLTVGSSLVGKSVLGFLRKKKNFLKKKQYSVFEQHEFFWKKKKKWSHRKLWNYFCWFFFWRFKYNSDKTLNVKHGVIVFWDILSSYKAWRHCRGYPVNGQRTWSNGKSCMKNNMFLRNYRLKQMQDTFGTSRKASYVILIQAEAVNKLWLRTWPYEWLQGRYHAIRSKTKRSFSIAIDINNLAKAVTTGYRRHGAGERWNKSKKALRTVTVGLPIYFSRFFLGAHNFKFFKYRLTLLQPERKVRKQNKKKIIKKKIIKKKKKNKKWVLF